jgi:hypothetical protein
MPEEGLIGRRDRVLNKVPDAVSEAAQEAARRNGF